MTEEHKKKIKEGRERAKKLRDAGIVTKKKSVFDKPIVRYTGNEKDAFDFVPLVRAAFRRQHNYLASPKIVHEITDKRFWQNIEWIKTTLSKYVILEKIEKPIKERKKRKPLTEEQIANRCESLKKAREARSKKNDPS